MSERNEILKTVMKDAGTYDRQEVLEGLSPALSDGRVGTFDALLTAYEDLNNGVHKEWR